MPNSATIAVVGTLDSKGAEHAFVAEQLRALGHQVLLIDVGTLETPATHPDITRDQVAASGGIDLAGLQARRDRGECVTAMANALPIMLKQLAEESHIHGVISLGGGGGTAIATAGMRALPIGFPKLMVSTLASGNTAHYIESSDIVMMPSVVDVAGLNRISRAVLTRAAGAIAGMVSIEVAHSEEDKPLIVASMFGNTTDCVNACQKILQSAGYEVLVFHATGTGGKAMESLIRSGMVAGVLDLTTTEWADEIVGGTLSAGPTRMDAAAEMGLPTVIAPGCLDMANFGEPDTVPEQYADRLFYQHNPQVTLMRTSAEECARLGEILATKANAANGPTTVLIPTQALSVISAEGQVFHDAAADEALFSAIHAHAKVPVVEYDLDINDQAFASHCVETLLAHLPSTVPSA